MPWLASLATLGGAAKHARLGRSEVPSIHFNVGTNVATFTLDSCTNVMMALVRVRSHCDGALRELLAYIEIERRSTY